jgi:hypothetical protein
MTNKMLMKKHSSQAIAAINNLIIPEIEKLKLKTMAIKIYHSVNLTQEEKVFWNSFPNSEKWYILTGDTESSLNFTEYQRAGNVVGDQFQEEVQHAPQVHHQEHHPNLFFDPSSSEDSDSSEDPDYIPPTPLRRVITTSDDSWPDNSNSQTSVPSSTANQAGNQNHPVIDSDSEISSDREIEVALPEDVIQEAVIPQAKPVTSPRGRPPGSKNQPNSWKYTSAPKCKPMSKIVVEADPEAIATRTRSKQNQDVPAEHGYHPYDLKIDAVCCHSSKQECAKSPSSVQKNWKLCYRCALSPCENSSKHVKNH